MAEDPNTSLVSLGDVTKPADTLIKKISKAVGGIFAPGQIRRVAKAEAEAAIITARAAAEVAIIEAETGVRVTELHRRAAHRLLEEEARRQANMEAITAKALPQLTEAANADAVDDDWVTNFFDKSRIVSDEQMQQLWARVLAGEVNVPGSYSRRAVNLLSDLDKADCEMFSLLRNFCWDVPGLGLVPLMYEIGETPGATIYREAGVTYPVVSHLESIGLIQYSHLTEYSQLHVGRHWVAVYLGRALILKLPKDADNAQALGHAVLTRVGQELARVCEPKPIDGFYDYVRNRWAAFVVDPENSGDAASAPEPTTQPPKSPP